MKSPVSGMSDVGDKIHRHSPSVPVRAIFYADRGESPDKSTNQIGRFLSHDFSKWRIATILGAWEQNLSGKSPRSA